MSQMVNVEDFIESLTEEQKECVYWIVGNAAKLRDRQKYYDVYMTLTEAQKENLWGVVSLAMEILRGQWMTDED